MITTQPQAFKQAERELQRERERTKVAHIFDFPGITAARVLARPARAGVSFEDVTREKPTKRKPKRFIPPKFKAEKGITKPFGFFHL